MSNSLAIGIAALRGQFDTEGSLEDVLVSAMRVARRYGRLWHAVDEEERAKCAIGAVMEHFGEGSEEWDRLETSLRLISDLMSGNLMAIIAHGEDEDALEIVAIPKLWRESRESA